MIVYVDLLLNSSHKVISDLTATWFFHPRILALVPAGEFLSANIVWYEILTWQHNVHQWNKMSQINTILWSRIYLPLFWQRFKNDFYLSAVFVYQHYKVCKSVVSKWEMKVKTNKLLLSVIQSSDLRKPSNIWQRCRIWIIFGGIVWAIWTVLALRFPALYHHASIGTSLHMNKHCSLLGSRFI